MSFQIILREGITGGFVAPKLKQMVQIEGDDEGATILHAKPDSSGALVQQTGTLSREQVSSLVNDLESKLKLLPTEVPGTQDIYGQDTSISFSRGKFQWQNGGQEGCGQGESVNAASVEQKETFKQLTDSILNVGQEYAVQQQ